MRGEALIFLLATAGGLTDQGEAWRKPAHSRFLVPGYALSTIFRAKVRDALDHENLLAQVDPAVFRKSWNVHLEHAGDGDGAPARRDDLAVHLSAPRRGPAPPR